MFERSNKVRDKHWEPFRNSGVSFAANPFMNEKVLDRIRKYRGDIDGLRSIAVLLVIFDHFQFKRFQGGYIGVDVFFVISGYLIGSSLIAEFDENRFRLGKFYERRIRRIFPALLVMLFIVSLFAYHFLLPQALVDYAGSLIATLFSFSNLYFWHQAGYFDAPSAAKPLLHTWSLAVEEQFYVVFPIILFCLHRWLWKYLRPVLWAVAAITLGLSIWTVRIDAPTAFFWSPFRAWELLAGVLISQYSLNFLRSRWLREAAAATGLLLILLPALRYTSETPFPGLAALLPCIGAVLIIAAGHVGKTVSGSLLSTWPCTFVGRISYSLYLWHWPLLVFQNAGLILTSKPTWVLSTKLALLAVSFILATLSWGFVETPLRVGQFKPSRARLFRWTAGTSLTAACLAVWFICAHGVPSRFPAEILRISQYSNYNTAEPWRTGTCFLMPTSHYGSFQPATCLSPQVGKKNYLLYGDSTAAQLYPGLVHAFPNVHIEQATAAGCHPYKDMSDVVSIYRPNCRDLWTYIHSTYLPNEHPDLVIIASAWLGSSVPLLGAEIRSFQDRGIPVILVGPEILFDSSVPLLMTRVLQQRDPPESWAARMSQHLLASNPQLDLKMSAMARDQWHVPYVSYFQDFCTKEVVAATKSSWETADHCALFTASGDLLIFDNHHFTVAGSELFVDTIRRRGEL